MKLRRISLLFFWLIFVVGLVWCVPFVAPLLRWPWALSVSAIVVSCGAVFGSLVLARVAGLAPDRLPFLLTLCLCLGLLNGGSSLLSGGRPRLRRNRQPDRDLPASSERAHAPPQFDLFRNQSTAGQDGNDVVAFALMYDKDDGDGNELVAVQAHVRTLHRLDPDVAVLVLAARGQLETAAVNRLGRVNGVTVVPFDPVPRSAYRPAYLKHVDRIRLWSPLGRLPFTKLVFVDNHSVVLRSLRWLFQYPGWPPTFSQDAEQNAKPGSGILVLRPDRAVETALLRASADYLPTYSTSVYAMFDWFFAGSIGLLPWNACMSVRSVFTPPLHRFDEDAVPCVHWPTGVRPWDRQKRNDLDAQFTPLWKQYTEQKK